MVSQGEKFLESMTEFEARCCSSMAFCGFCFALVCFDLRFFAVLC